MADISDTKIRALVFSTAYYPFVGGAEVAVKEITDRLPRYEWELITARMSHALPVVEKVGSITLYRVGVGHKTIDKFLLPFFGFLKARSLHRKNRYAIAWSMMASQASIAAALFKLWDRKVRLVLTLQEGDEEQYLKRYVGGNDFLYRLLIRPWHRLVFRRADYVTAISRYLKVRAENSGVASPVEIIPNGVDLERFKRAEPRSKVGDTVLVTTSRLVEKNDLASVIRALVYLPESVRFEILGIGPLETELRSLVSELHLETRVSFVGHVDHSRIVGMMEKADIFIRPSLSEGLGSSFLEAMALGLPIIATPVGGIPDFLHDGKTGLFCGVKDPKSIAEKVLFLMNNQEACRGIGEAGRKLVLEKYDWSLIAVAMARVAFDPAKQFPSVLIAASIYPPDPGGPALHAKQQYDLYRERGVRVRIVALAHFRSWPPVVRHLLFLWALIRESGGMDVLYAHDPQGVGSMVWFLSCISGKKYMVRIGGDLVWERKAEQRQTDCSMQEFYDTGSYRGFLFYVVWFVLRSADAVIVPSPLLRNLYVRYYGVRTEKVTIIPNPVTFAGGEKAMFVSKKTKAILFASRLVAYKNLSGVLTVLAGLFPRHPDLVFKIYGDGPEKGALEEEARQLGISSQVLFLGTVSQGRIAEETAECYAGLAPALTEFNPNYILRCIGLGKPFLISRENGFPFAVPHEFLFAPRNKKELEERLEWLLSEDGYQEAVRLVRGIRFTMTWDDSIAENLRIIKTVCGY